MPRITWRLADGTEITANVPVGHNLMEAAVDNDVEGVIGECGGGLACATCHVLVDFDWVEKVGKPGDLEDEMLDMTDAERGPTSRLSCQIDASDTLDGLLLHVPKV